MPTLTQPFLPPALPRRAARSMSRTFAATPRWCWQLATVRAQRAHQCALAAAGCLQACSPHQAAALRGETSLNNGYSGSRAAPKSSQPKPIAGHLAVVEFLLSEGAGMEQRSVMQETALMWAGAARARAAYTQLPAAPAL